MFQFEFLGRRRAREDSPHPACAWLSNLCPKAATWVGRGGVRPAGEASAAVGETPDGSHCFPSLPVPSHWLPALPAPSSPLGSGGRRALGSPCGPRGLEGGASCGWGRRFWGGFGVV